MSVAVQIQDGLTPVLEKLEKNLPGVLSKGLLIAAEHASGELRRQVRVLLKPGTGALSGSFKVSLFQYKGGIAAGALSDLPYADIQNRGGTIVPKRSGGALAVPVGPGKDLPVGSGPRSISDLELIPRVGKPPLLARVKKMGKGKKDKLTVYFVLLKSVTLKGRKYVEAATKESEDVIREILDEHAQISVDRADQ